MNGRTYPSLDVTPFWSRMNEQFIQLIDVVPDDKFNWSPKPELWNFRGILLHVPMARHNWLVNTVKDGETTPDVLGDGRTREGMKEQYRLSWQRLERFLSDPERIAATYQDVWYDEPVDLTGHWIACHLFEHDVHHRADIFHYLALLGIEHPQVSTP